MSVFVRSHQVAVAIVGALAEFPELFWAPASLPPQETNFPAPGKLLTALWESDSGLRKLLPRTTCANMNDCFCV